MAVVGAALSAIGGFLGTAASAIGAGGFFATVAGRLLTSVALSALSRALAPKPSSQAAGIRTTATMTGGVNLDAFILGWYSTEGQLVAPPMSHGKSGKTPNYYLNYVIEVCGIPGAQLDGLIIDGEPVEIGTTPHEDYGLPILGRFEGRAWIRYHDGSQTAADAMLVAKYPAPYVRPWGADRIGAGLCYAVMTFAYDREVWSGFPKVRFVLHGIPLYDPRKDSTQPGGSGPQRWGQPATWTASTNPIVQIYNILRGITFPGGEVWGGEVEAADLPLALWTAAMARCDSTVNDRPRYRSGFEVRADDEPFSVVEELLKAASADLSEIGGEWLISVGEPDLPVMFISDEDIVVTESEEYEPFPAPDETYNGITASYPSPAAAWESKESKPIHFAEMEAEDGGRRLMADLSLPAVPWAGQVQRLSRAYVKDNRRWRRHVLTLGFAAALLQPHDTISWTSERNFYSAKLFEVVEAVRDPQVGLVQVVLRERDPTDYDPAPEVLPDPPTLTPVLPAVQAVPGWTVEAVTLADGAGNPRRPAIRMGWAADAMEDARGLRWQIRLADDPSGPLRGSTQDIEAGTLTVAAGVLPASVYQVRARIVADRPSEWSSWISVVTADIRLGQADLDWTDLETEILDQLADLEGWINGELDLVDDTLNEAQQDIATLTAEQAQQAADLAAQAAALLAETAARGDLAISTARHYRDLARSMESIRDYVAELDYQSYSAREELRRQISVVVEGYAASFDERITVAASSTGAIAERVTVLEAGSEDLAAQIITVDTARVNGENALAQQIAAVSVGTNTQFDQVKIWYFDVETEGWTGSPSNPTTLGGYLRPAPGADSWIASPGAMAVEAEVYSQTRARLRRVGSPAWTGYLWWQATGAGWDAGRRVSIPEPTWVDGIADITATPAWAGQIDQIRLDLATAPDGANYIEVDWIAVGRPSPGASRAELIAERTARISADSAQASAIETLEAALTDLEGDTAATASAVQALDGRVTTTEGGLISQATAITGLQADMGGKASATAVSELTVEVGDLSDGLRSQSSAVIALRNSIDPMAGDEVETMFMAYLLGRDVREAAASADEVLRTDVGVQGGALTVLSEKVTALEATVPGLASASAMEALRARVTVAEGSIVSQSEAITSLQSAVDGKASASALSALTTRVTDTENGLTSVSSSLLALTTTIAGKASAAALSSLTARVSDAEAALSSQSAAITTLQNDLTGKASSTAVTALTSRVTSAEGQISSQASLITSLQGSLAGKADVSALNTLTGRVTSVETVAGSKNKVYRQNTAPGGLTTADAGDLWFKSNEKNRCRRWDGAEWVDVQDGEIPDLVTITTSQAAAITALQSGLAGKADASAVSSLTTRVTTVETVAGSKNKVSRGSSAPPDPTNGDLWFDSANADKCWRWNGSNWISVQDKNIPTLITTTTAHSEALTALDTSVGKFKAGGRFRVSVEATPSGATSRIGLSATASDGAATQTAALFLEATAAGDNRVLVRADRFAIINGDARDVPFIVDGGVTYIKTAMIKDADIGTLKIAGNAITIPVRTFEGAVVDITGTGWVTVAELRLRRKGYASEFTFSATVDGYGNGTLDFVLTRGTSNEIVRRAGFTGAPNGRQTQVTFSGVDWDSGSGMTVYRIRARKSDPSVTAGWNANMRVFRRYFSAVQFQR